MSYLPILTYENDIILTGSKIEFGPIMPGDYIVTIDIDGDDFSESSLEFTVDSNEQSDFVLPSPIRDHRCNLPSYEIRKWS